MGTLFREESKSLDSLDLEAAVRTAGPRWPIGSIKYKGHWTWQGRTPMPCWTLGPLVSENSYPTWAKARDLHYPVGFLGYKSWSCGDLWSSLSERPGTWCYITFWCEKIYPPPSFSWFLGCNLEFVISFLFYSGKFKLSTSITPLKLNWLFKIKLLSIQILVCYSMLSSSFISLWSNSITIMTINSCQPDSIWD